MPIAPVLFHRSANDKPQQNTHLPNPCGTRPLISGPASAAYGARSDGASVRRGGGGGLGETGGGHDEEDSLPTCTVAGPIHKLEAPEVLAAKRICRLDTDTI